MTIICKCGVRLEGHTAPQPGKWYCIADVDVVNVGEKLRDVVAAGSDVDGAFFMALEHRFDAIYECQGCGRVVHVRGDVATFYLKEAG